MRKHALLFCTVASLLLLPSGPVCPQDVLTQHNDSARTGLNAKESILTPANVGSGGFGKLFSRSVVGSVYAQPLYMNGVTITGKGTFNVLFVATMHNLVYAFDADGRVEEPLWGPVSLGTPVALPDLCIGPTSGTRSTYHDIAQEIGIMSTPVISKEEDALYAVAFSKAAETFAYSLNKLDVSSGALRTSTFATSTCSSSTTGPAGFQVNRQNQRPGLLLAGGNVYAGFAAFGDEKPWVGWVFGFDAGTLALLQRAGQPAVFKTANSGAGIWMSGNGLAADSDNNVYFSTGNGTFSPTVDLGESIIKLNPGLELVDWFAPCDAACLNSKDLDLSSAGVLLVPDESGGKNLLVGGGKEGKLYLLDRDQFGTQAIPNFSCTDEQILQSFCVGGACGQCCSPSDGCSGFSCNNRPTCTASGHLRASPVYWKNTNGQFVYVWPQNAPAQSYELDAGRLALPAASQGTITSPEYPGGLVSISANGEDASSGILWATLALDNANQQVVPGIAYAFDASELSKELWNSRTRPQDHLGNFSKFPPPTVASGKVYVATLGLLQDTPSLGVTPVEGPAVANLNDTTLAAAWTSPSNAVQMACSDEPLQWVYGDGVNPVRTGGQSSHGPALASGNGLLFLAWTDSSQQQLNVTSSSDCQSFTTAVALSGETSQLGPALAFGNGTLFLSWTGTDKRLNVVSSTDNGQTFGNKVTLHDTSNARPGLAFFDSTLFLMWSGTDGRHTLNILESSNGTSFGNRHLLGIFSPAPPAMAKSDAINFMWTDVDGVLNHAITDRRFSKFVNDVTYGTTNGSGPSLTLFQDVLWVGWSGVEGSTFVHVAPWKAPEVVVYGLQTP